MSSKSDISDITTPNSLLNISKSDIVNTSVIFKSPEPVEYCLTKFNFEASKNDELSFKAEQYIRVIKKVDGGWWEGKLDERVRNNSYLNFIYNKLYKLIFKRKISILL